MKHNILIYSGQRSVSMAMNTKLALLLRRKGLSGNKTNYYQL